MATQPLVKLSVLRDIGWAEWDPIGLQTIEGGWQGSNAANEYDQYLLRVAGGLERGEPDGDLVDYLVDIEIDHMGAGSSPTAQSRAAATVRSIREYVQSLTQ